MTQESHIKEKAITMLGSGTPANIVASALGVTESAISQLLSQEEVSNQVSELRFKSLHRQTELDDKYTTMEETLLAKLEKVLPLMTKPRDVAATLAIINNTKRRGAQNTTANNGQSQVVNLTIPITIAHKFISNVNNQVVEVHDESGSASSLVTASSGSLDGLYERIVGGASSNSDEAPKRLGVSPGTEVVSTGSGESRSNKGSDSRAISVEDLL
jgi:hypothetical protein